MSSTQTDHDVVVVGAGIVGVCCALALLERGLSVHVIDRSPPGEGASHGNAGVISPWSFIPQSLPGVWRQVPGWIADPRGPLKIHWPDSPKFAPWAARFVREGSSARYPRNAQAMAQLIAPSIAQYRHWLKDIGPDNYITNSKLVSLIAGPPPSLDDPGWRLRIERGALVRLVNSDELREIEPAVGPRYSGAVLLDGQARALSPGLLCKALAEQAQNIGAKFTESAVKGLSVDSTGSPVIALDGRTVRANQVVLAAGPWSKQLLQPLALPLRLPLIGERGYHLEFTEPGVKLNNSVMDPVLKFIVSSMRNGIRAAGTSELANLDRTPNYQRARILSDLTVQMMPELNTAKTEQWMGTRASFPDSLPAIGRVPGAKRIIAAFGQSHWGMSMAPGTGMIVGAIAADTQPFTDPDPYHPQRFGR